MLGNAATSFSLLAMPPSLGPVTLAGDQPGTAKVRFDGDGDQLVDMEITIALTDTPGKTSRSVHVVLTQMSSGYSHTFDLEFPDTSAPLPTPLLSAVTDGKHPTEFSLTSMCVLRVYPGQNIGAAGVLYMVAVGVTGEEQADITAPQILGYPQESVSPVFSARGPSPLEGGITQTAPILPVLTGDIWSLDLGIGLYHDRFRLSFRQIGGTIVFGLAALDEGQPLGGERVDLMLSRPLAVRILDDTGAKLSLDLDGDGLEDLALYDRLTVPTAEELGKLQGYDPLFLQLRTDGLYRNHEIFAEGSSLPAVHTFYFSVREGRIQAASTERGEFQRAAASDIKAAGGLAEQRRIGTFADKQGQLQGELAQVETLLGTLRQQARDEKLISGELYAAWQLLSQDFILLDVLRAGNAVDDDFIKQLGGRAESFAALLEKETESATEAQPSADEGFGPTTYINPYTGRSETVGLFTDYVYEPSKQLAVNVRAANWDAAIKAYRSLMNGFDRWVAHTNRVKYGEAERSKPETMRGVIGETLAGRRSALQDLAVKAPTRVAAVLHPAESFEEEGSISEVPLSLYYWHDDQDWYIKDVTNPDDMPRWSVACRRDSEGKIPEEPPDELFAALDEGSHFPRGTIHWLLPSGHGGQVETSGPSWLLRGLTYLGLAAAAIGLGMVTLGTGTVAVVGGYVLAGSALLGAGMAAYDIVEGFRHDTMTAGRFVLDVAQIVQSVAGLGALRMGQILAGARAVAAEGAVLEATTALKMANRFFVPLRATEMAATGVTLAVMTEDMAKQIHKIQDSGAPDSEKFKAYSMLIGQFAFTAGLSALAIKGAIPELTAGRSISIEVVNGVEYAVPVGTSVPGRAVDASRAKAVSGEGGGEIDAHLSQIRSSIGGEAGSALADVEAMVLRPETEGAFTIDSGGELRRSGVAVGTLDELQRKVTAANNAGAAHGTDTAFIIEIGPQGADKLSPVRVKATPRTATTSSATVLRTYLAAQTGRLTEVAEMAAHLRIVDPASRVEIMPDGQLRLNGQIEIDAARLADVQKVPDDLRTLLKATRELEALGGKVSGLDPKAPPYKDLLRLAKSGTYRLRFKFHADLGRGFAADLDLTPGARAMLEGLIGNADQDALVRLFDLMNENVPGKGAQREARSLFAEWAAARQPKDLYEFIDAYQYIRAEAIQRAEEIENATENLLAAAKARGERLDRQEALQQLGYSGKGRQTNYDAVVRDELRAAKRQATLAEAFAAEQAAARPKTGSVAVPGPTDDLSTVTRVREAFGKLGYPPMADESTLAYHVHKHHHEMPKGEQYNPGKPSGPQSELDAYLKSAMETINKQDLADVKSYATQDGTGRILTFERTVVEGNDTFRTRALVLVGYDGNATLLTYMPGPQ
jgi:hypothetical protein